MHVRKRERGFTLIELLIVVAIVGIIAAILFGIFGSWRRGSAAYAEAEFGPFAKKLGWEVRGVSCAAIDSDGDGYISCAARIVEDGRTQNVAVECASGAWALPWNRTGGCRLAMPTMQGTGSILPQ